MTGDVAIILTSTDEGHLLVPAIESLFAHLPDRKHEVVVLDNASADRAGEDVTARWPEVRVITQPERRGLPANINRGMAETTSPYAMWCDADMIFRPGAVDLLAQFLDEHPRAGAVKPKLVSPEGTPRASARRWYTLGTLLALRGPWRPWTERSALVRRSVYADWDYTSPRSVDWLPFAGVMVRRESFDEVGGADERFPYYFEDVDFSLRLHLAGWERWCLPKAEMVHLENRASLKVLSKAGRLHMKALVKFLAKHGRMHP